MKKQRLNTTPPVKKERRYVSANLDPAVQIREDEVQFYHVEQVRVTILPHDPLNPITTRWIKCWRPVNWKRFKSLMGGMIDPVKAAGLVSVREVHSPELAEQNDYREKKAKAMKGGQ